MRVLLDTNVWVASFIARGTSSDLVEHLEHNHQVLTSEWLLDELRDVLTRKFDYSRDRVDRVEAFVRSSAECIPLTEEPPDVSEDPDDNYVLLSASEGKVDLLVTGDQDLLVLESFEGIDIVPPDRFWEVETT